MTGWCRVQGHIWTAELPVPCGPFVFKLALQAGDGTGLRWQPGGNVRLEVPEEPALLRMQVSWTGEASVEVEALSASRQSAGAAAPAPAPAPHQEAQVMRPCCHSLSARYLAVGYSL